MKSQLLDVEALRADFPILERKVHGKRLVYLDNAATTQKPRVVIDALADFYSNHNANVHRGVHQLSIEATEAYEKARAKAAPPATGMLRAMARAAAASSGWPSRASRCAAASRSR